MGDIAILLADERATVREGLRGLLEGQPGLSVVGEAGDGREAVALAARLAPDVVIMDLHLSRVDSIDATQGIAMASPQTRILMLSMEWHDGAALEAMKAGAWGCVRREASATELGEAVRVIHGGQVGTTALMTSRLVTEYCRNTSETRVRQTHALTPRDQRFLSCLCDGSSNREIAQKLRLSEQTVKNTLSTLYQKMSVDNRVEAAAYYRRLSETALA